jgi:membrane-associated protease RseP (regulator of RpoE activity)
MGHRISSTLVWFPLLWGAFAFGQPAGIPPPLPAVAEAGGAPFDKQKGRDCPTLQSPERCSEAEWRLWADLRAGPVTAAEPAPTMGRGDSPQGRCGLGVSFNNTSAQVLSILEGSPAAMAGIVAGDIIGTVDGVFTMSARQVQQQIASHECGEQLDLGLVNMARPTEWKHVTVTLGNIGTDRVPSEIAPDVRPAASAAATSNRDAPPSEERSTATAAQVAAGVAAYEAAVATAKAGVGGTRVTSPSEGAPSGNRTYSGPEVSVGESPKQVASHVEVAPENAAKGESAAPKAVNQPISLTKVQLQVVMKGVRERLKDPDSAKFGEIRASKQRETTVCGYVNAKNSFGGYVGKSRFIGLLYGGAFVLVAIGSDEISGESTLEVCRSNYGISLP